MMKMVKRRHKEDFQVTKPESWIQLETSKLQTKSARLQLGNCLDTRHLTRTALTVAAGTGGALRSSGTPPRHVQKENVCDIMWHFDQTLGAKPLSRTLHLTFTKLSTFVKTLSPSATAVLLEGRIHQKFAPQRDQGLILLSIKFTKNQPELLTNKGNAEQTASTPKSTTTYTLKSETKWKCELWKYKNVEKHLEQV